MKYTELTNQDNKDKHLLTNEVLGNQQNNQQAYFKVKK